MNYIEIAKSVLALIALIIVMQVSVRPPEETIISLFWFVIAILLAWLALKLPESLE